MRTIEEIDQEIQKTKADIIKLNSKLNSLKEERFEVLGLIEICWSCGGSGKTIIGHSFRDGDIYGGCCVKCNGIGRIKPVC